MHQLILVTDWEAITRQVATEAWDVAFIDQAPWDARTVAVKALKDIARFIVLHDCDLYTRRELLNFEELFRSFKVFLPPKPWPGKTGPPTLLASNFEDCDLDIDYVQYKFH